LANNKYKYNTNPSDCPDSFFENLLSRFEEKLNNWLQTSLKKKIESIAETALTKIVATEEFKDTILVKVSENVLQKSQFQLNNVYSDLDDF